MSRTVAWMVAVAALAFSSAALASPGSLSCESVPRWVEVIDDWFHITPDCVPTPSTTVLAPEMDAASTIGAVTLLLGGLLVLRGRKARA
jgi:hypothetical protein